MNGTGEIAVGVPVRNELARLPDLLDALARQIGAPAFTLCLFFDNCTDGSVELVRLRAAGLPFPIRTRRGDGRGPPNAGLARGRAMALAAAAAPNGILLTTDGDGEPAPDWIAANLASLVVADLVAGRILRGAGLPCPQQDRMEAYYDRLHDLRRALDPVAWEGQPTHHWTSGASLAMHAATYRALGGFAPLANGEDAALCDAAARASFRVRRDAGVVVSTSARRQGRAAGGFAAALAAFDAADRLPAITHPEDEAWRFRMHAEARPRHGSGDYTRLAHRLGIPLAEVARVAAGCRGGEGFAARIVGTPPGGARTVRLDHAERLLSILEQAQLQGAA